MEIEILSIFPGLFESFLAASLIGKARERGLIRIACTDIRDFAAPPHRQVDDLPYGGGAGMLMKPEPLVAAVEAAQQRLPQAKVVLFSPGGRLLDQALVEELSRESQLVLLCGRYEGVDQRVADLVVDLEVSIGDYVLMGGEVPAMALIEAVARLRPEVLGNSASAAAESFSAVAGQRRVLEAPQYTRPPVFRELSVPPVLMSGNHKLIAEWRYEQALLRTRNVRPDLMREDGQAD